MKTLLVAIVIGLTGVASVAHAQTKLELYSDMARTSCQITDVTPGVAIIYIWVTGPVVVGGVRFKVELPACWQGATWVGFNLPPLTAAIGSLLTDVSIAWGCEPARMPPRLVASAAFLVSGQALPCCELIASEPVPYPFVFATCGTPSERPLVAGQKVVLNPNASCPCMSPLASEATTWGRVKSLYR